MGATQEVQQQVRRLREEVLSARWPGRVFDAAAPPALHGTVATPRGDQRAPGTPRGTQMPPRIPAASDFDDSASDTGSITDSVIPESAFGGSNFSGMSPDERAEVKKLQAIVGAAGTAFTRDLRAV